VTCYNCAICGRDQNICKLGVIEGEFLNIYIKFSLKINLTLCKWCMTKLGIEYKCNDNGEFPEIQNSSQVNQIPIERKEEDRIFD